jgi:hypothetical protein
LEEPLQLADALVLRRAFVDGAGITRERGEGVQIDASIEQAEIVIWERPLVAASIRGAEVFEALPCPPLPRRKQIWIPRYPFREPEEFILALFVDSYPGGDSDSYLSDPKSQQRFTDRGFATLDMLKITKAGVVVNGACRLIEGEPVEPADAKLLASMFFLDSEWIGEERETLPRHERRKYERERQPVPEVKTVVLRRSAREGSAHSAGDGSREYSCQWIVSGHWRKQYYPSKGEYAPKYIAPYPKGPVDKPLRTPRPTVYVAKR